MEMVKGKVYQSMRYNNENKPDIGFHTQARDSNLGL